MSISSTGLYGSATIVNSDLFTDVETLKETVTTLNTTYLQTTAEHRTDISQNRFDISQNKADMPRRRNTKPCARSWQRRSRSWPRLILIRRCGVLSSRTQGASKGFRDGRRNGFKSWFH